MLGLCSISQGVILDFPPLGQGEEESGSWASSYLLGFGRLICIVSLSALWCLGWRADLIYWNLEMRTSWETLPGWDGPALSVKHGALTCRIAFSPWLFKKINVTLSVVTANNPIAPHSLTSSLCFRAAGSLLLLIVCALSTTSYLVLVF